jgi:hypothetical protein
MCRRPPLRLFVKELAVRLREGVSRRRPAVSDVKPIVKDIADETGQVEVSQERPVVPGESPTMCPRHRLNQRGGLLLDAVLSFAFRLMAADTLETLGISFPQVTHAAMHFSGI